MKDNEDLTVYNRYYYENSRDENPQKGEEDIVIAGTKENPQIFYSEKDEINQEIRKNVEDYGGFYIGRYEIGIEGGTLTNTANDSNESNWTGWNNGTAVIKNNMQVWNYITGEKALEISKNIVNTENAKTYLMTSYCYDTAVHWIYKANSNKINKEFYNKIERTILKANTSNTTSEDNELTLNNIADIISNIYEYTTEKTFTKTQQTYNLRIGYHACSSTASFLDVTMGARNGETTESAVAKAWGFRCVLVIK